MKIIALAVIPVPVLPISSSDAASCQVPSDCWILIRSSNNDSSSIISFRSIICRNFFFGNIDGVSILEQTPLAGQGFDSRKRVVLLLQFDLHGAEIADLVGFEAPIQSFDRGLDAAYCSYDRIQPGSQCRK